MEEIFNRASVIMPVYNGGKYLAQAIESILAQTFTNFELILIDDGSTDHSLQVLQQFAQKDSRCVVISQKNQGLVTTLNLAVQSSESELIFRMDQDDVSLPTRFEKQIQFLKNNPDCIALGTRLLLIDSEGMPIAKLNVPTDHSEIDQLHMSGVGSVIFHPTVVYKKSYVEKAGAYRQAYEYAEDLDLYLRLAELGKIANLDEYLFDYRQHATSIGYAKRRQQLDAANNCILDAYQRRNLPVPDQFIAHKNEQTSESGGTSAQQMHEKWAWQALGAGNVQTARKHAIKSVQKSPFKLSSYRLLACALRGY